MPVEVLSQRILTNVNLTLFIYSGCQACKHLGLLNIYVDIDSFFLNENLRFHSDREFSETFEEVDIDQSFLRCISHNTTSTGYY